MAGKRDGTWRNVIDDVFTAKKDSLHGISRYLWKNPELSYHETKAHKYLTGFLEEEGFHVERSFGGDTGFRATFEGTGPDGKDFGRDSELLQASTNGGPAVLLLSPVDSFNGEDRNPHVCFICEYDSTADVGHTAGHNLKSKSSIAAALGIKECLEKKLFAGKATGCESEFHFEDTPYYPMQHNTRLGEMYREQAEKLGLQFARDCNLQDVYIGATDYGNVSQVVPCLLPAYDIKKKGHVHSVEFHDSCASQEAEECTLVAAKALAMTAAEVLSSWQTLESLKSDHLKRHGRSTMSVMQRLRSQSTNDVM